MAVTEKELNESHSNLWTTKRVEDLIKRQNLGDKQHLDEKIWFDNKTGVRKAGVKFAMTKREHMEWNKCALDVHYFADHYCYIKLEDGTIGQMTLRDYQKEIIDLYTQNRFSILMASRQMGKCVTMSTIVTVKDTITHQMFDISMGELYYKSIQMERKLTIYELLKYNIYKLITKL